MYCTSSQHVVCLWIRWPGRWIWWRASECRSGRCAEKEWAVVSDISETLDSKFQASLLSSDQNKRRTAYVKGCPRDLALWVFVPRMKDLCDGREFNGTVDQVRRFPSNETIPYVFSTEENIICEGFALTPEGYLPDTVIAKVKARLSESQWWMISHMLSSKYTEINDYLTKHSLWLEYKYRYATQRRLECIYTLDSMIRLIFGFCHFLVYFNFEVRHISDRGRSSII